MPGGRGVGAYLKCNARRSFLLLSAISVFVRFVVVGSLGILPEKMEVIMANPGSNYTVCATCGKFGQVADSINLAVGNQRYSFAHQGYAHCQECWKGHFIAACLATFPGDTMQVVSESLIRDIKAQMEQGNNLKQDMDGKTDDKKN